MAVIFASVPAAVVVIRATTYKDHSDYSDYHYDHSDYDNYSNAALLRQRRIEAKKQEIDGLKKDVNQYKINQINGYLSRTSLKNQSGEVVVMREVKEDGDDTLKKNEKTEKEKETRQLTEELKDIDAAIAAIDRILEEE